MVFYLKLNIISRFTEEYMENPRRGYGGNVINVFYELSKQENYQVNFMLCNLLLLLLFPFSVAKNVLKHLIVFKDIT